MDNNAVGILDFLPYITAIAGAIISGLVAYFTATKKSKSDLESLEKKYDKEFERLKLEHEQKKEIMQGETLNELAKEIILNDPGIRQTIVQKSKKALSPRRRRS